MTRTRLDERVIVFIDLTSRSGFPRFTSSAECVKANVQHSVSWNRSLGRSNCVSIKTPCLKENENMLKAAICACL